MKFKFLLLFFYLMPLSASLVHASDPNASLSQDQLTLNMIQAGRFGMQSGVIAPMTFVGCGYALHDAMKNNRPAWEQIFWATGTMVGVLCYGYFCYERRKFNKYAMAYMNNRVSGQSVVHERAKND